MVGVLKLAAIVLIIIGGLTGFIGLMSRKTVSTVLGSLIAVIGVASLLLYIFPNSITTNIETKAVELKYKNWEKSVTMVVSKELESHKVGRTGKRRRAYNYYICYTNGEIIKDLDNYKGSYLYVYIDDKMIPLKDVPNNNTSSVESVKSDIYNNLYKGETIIVAKKKQSIGYKVEFILPEYTPKEWKEEYGIS